MPGGLSTADDRRSSDWNRSARLALSDRIARGSAKTRLQESAPVKYDEVRAGGARSRTSHDAVMS
jgi:hypothetical protein